MDRLGALITMAGQTRPGFFTLILLFLSGFMIVALDRAPPFIRLAAYAGLAAALAMFSWLIWQAHKGTLPTLAS